MTSNFVVGLMLMGAREEPYLGAVLESLRDAVDVLVVNDNSGQEKSSNRRTLEESALFRKEQVEIVEAPFDGFANARNRCLENIRQRYSDKAWILVVDCDEVHGAQLPHLTREVAPALPTRVGVVDGYFVQFMQSFDYF
ncbi:MAG: glycosyltransferase, partial [Armatimonadetes bacterium]|nr:glycosyltransferase [Armatimonadota bacterium]